VSSLTERESNFLKIEHINNCRWIKKYLIELFLKLYQDTKVLSTLLIYINDSVHANIFIEHRLDLQINNNLLAVESLID